LEALGCLPLIAKVSSADDSPPASRARGTVPKGPDEALQALKEGNRRFAAGKVIHAHQASDWRKNLTGGQHPFATILACSDSRVPPELVFDQGFGDLFVIRVAGNIIAPDVLGSMGYALHHLKTPLFVVMGHEGCGAVTAALEAIDGKGEEPKYIAQILQHMIPGLKDLDRGLQGDRRVNAGVEANVRWSAKIINGMPQAKEATARGEVRLMQAVYELETGRVRFLD